MRKKASKRKPVSSVLTIKQNQIVTEFKKDLQIVFVGFDKLKESMVKDLYQDIKNLRSPLEVKAFFYQAIENSGRNTFKYFSYKHFYEYWLIRFIGYQISMHESKNYDPNLYAGYLIKELGRGRTDKYHHIAYVSELRAIWLRGGLDKENKQYLKEELEIHGEETTKYGIGKLKTKTRISYTKKKDRNITR